MRKFLSIIGGFATFIISLILFFVQLSFLIFVSIRTLINQDVFNDILKNINIVEVINENVDSSSKEEIYKVTGSLGLTKDETDTILNSNSLKLFVTEVLSNNIESIYNDNKVTYTSKNIEELISDIEKETSIEIKNKDKLTDMLNKNSSEINKYLNISENLKTNLEVGTLKSINVFLGESMFIFFAISLIIFYLLMCFFTWSFYKPFIWYGTTSLIVGVIFLISSLTMIIAVPYLITKESEKYKNLIENVVKQFQEKTFIFGGAFVLLGILLIVIYVLIKKNKKPDLKENKIEMI